MYGWLCVTQRCEAFGASEAGATEAELLNVVRVELVSVHYGVQLVLVSVHIHLRATHAEERDKDGYEHEAAHDEERERREAGYGWTGRAGMDGG